MKYMSSEEITRAYQVNEFRKAVKKEQRIKFRNKAGKRLNKYARKRNGIE